MTAVIQVLLDTLVINAEPVAEPAGLDGSPWEDLRARVRALRQQARVRLRARTSRMGIDLATADHVVDAVDQQIEVAVARVEKLISVAEEPSEPLAAEAQAAIVEKLQGATEQIEQAVERVDTTVLPAENPLGTSGPTVPPARAEPGQATGHGEQAVEPVATAIATTTETQGPVRVAEPEAIVDDLDQAQPTQSGSGPRPHHLSITRQEQDHHDQRWRQDAVHETRQSVAAAGRISLLIRWRENKFHW